MARGFTVSESIRRPPETVWALLADPALMPLWMDSVEAMAPAQAGPLGEGSRLQARLTTRGRGADSEVRIVGWEPGRRMALSSSEGGVTAVYDYRCRPAGAGTEVTLDARCEVQGWLWRLLHPLIAFMMKRTDGKQLANLKRVVEQDTG